MKLAIFMLLMTASVRPGHVNYRVPKEAIESAELIDCDRSEPPNCRAVNLVYKSGSEQLIVSSKTEGK